MSAIDTIIKDINALKPIPQIAHQILACTEDPNRSISDIADIVLYDPLITATLLRICNSAYFNLPRRIDSIKEAISYLGLEQVIELVLLKSGADVLNNKQEGYGLHEGELWHNAVASAIVAKELSEKLNITPRNRIFTGALLKDIGKIILDRFVSNAFNNINKLVKNDGYSFREAEKAVIGIDHAELGGIIAKKWKFSPQLTTIITHHHLAAPEKRKDPEIAVVYVSDMVCNMMGVGVGVDALAYRFHEDALKNLGISPMDLEALMAVFGEKLNRVQALIHDAGPSE